MNIKQQEDESLRSYVTWLSKEALLINEADDKVLVIAFSNGLRARDGKMVVMIKLFILCFI